MSRPLRFYQALPALLVLLSLSSDCLRGAAPDIGKLTRQLAHDRGILVHLGSDDAARTVQLHAQGQFVVQALHRDPETVANVRRHIQANAQSGPISANRLSGPGLPFADNLINVLVVDDNQGISRDEMLRVLRPLGTAWIARRAVGETAAAGSHWEKVTKP